MARAGSGGPVTSKASVRKTSLTRGREATAKRSKAALANGNGEPIVVYFDDTGLARDLFGHFDANLVVLEDRLGIKAVVNGNAVALRGREDAPSRRRHGSGRPQPLTPPEKVPIWHKNSRISGTFHGTQVLQLLECMKVL